MNNPDNNSESLETIFYFNSLMWTGMEKIRIRYKHPGFTTLSCPLLSYLDSVEEAQLGRVAKDDNHPVLDDSGGVARTVDLPAELTVAPAPVHRLHLPGQGVQVEGPQLLHVEG
jgi:hypothetical protein